MQAQVVIHTFIKEEEIILSQAKDVLAAFVNAALVRLQMDSKMKPKNKQVEGNG